MMQKNEGYLYVEAYPFIDEKYPYQFHGPAKMYKNRGFQLFDKKSWFLIMQKSYSVKLSKIVLQDYNNYINVTAKKWLYYF